MYKLALSLMIVCMRMLAGREEISNYYTVFSPAFSEAPVLTGFASELLSVSLPASGSSSFPGAFFLLTFLQPTKTPVTTAAHAAASWTSYTRYKVSKSSWLFGYRRYMTYENPIKRIVVC